jgi:hypothetical protein
MSRLTEPADSTKGHNRESNNKTHDVKPLLIQAELKAAKGYKRMIR